MKQIVIVRLDLKLTGPEQVTLASKAAALGIAKANPAAVKEWMETGPNVEVIYVNNFRDMLTLGMRSGMNSAYAFAENGSVAAVAVGPATEALFGYIDGFQGR